MKYRTILRILIIALTLSLLTFIPLVVPVLAAEEIAITPSEGEIDDEITIVGSGFNPSNNTTYGAAIYFAKESAIKNNRVGTSSVSYDVNTFERVKVVEIDDEGEFNTTFDVPSTLNDGTDDEDVTKGTYYIYMTYYYPSSGTYSPYIKAIDQFEVVAGEITVSPIVDVVGAEVSVSGSGFTASGSVTIKFDSIQVGTAQTTSAGSFSNFTFAVPESKYGSHTIEGVDQSNNSGTATFTTTQSIAITPEAGAVGDEVSASGSGFRAGQSITVYFDDDNVAATTTNDLGSFSASFGVPSLASGSYQVEASDGTNSANADFTLSANINLIPNTGFTGSDVVITGTGLQASKSSIPVLFDNELVTTVTTDNKGTFTASFVVPVGNAGTHTVTANDGINIATATFTISTGATISPETSTAAPGYVGSELTINGLGFTPGRNITVIYDGNEVATGMVESDGTFSLSFIAPAGDAGEHSVKVTDLINTAEFTFVMESTPPIIPAPLKPEMDIKAQAMTYFDWQDVNDPSGVTYTLQIATDETFEVDSILLEQTELAESEYTLTREERLKSAGEESPYYWRIRAVDGANNISGWSGTGAFYVGGFSLELSTPIIITFIVVGGLVLLVVGFFIGRRTAYY